MSVPDTLRVISSMATRQLLAELAQRHRALHGAKIDIESTGGVDAFKRIAGGEQFDLVVLAADAIDRLLDEGHLAPAGRTDLVESAVAVAVRRGAARPDIADEAALKQAVIDAPSIGYSTGPSGAHLLRLFERWAILDQLEPKLLQAPAGVPVGALIADGRVALGFQQLSELLNVPGIDLLGPMPAPIQIITTFSAGLGRQCRQPQAARAFLSDINSAAAIPIKRRHGMQPARAQ